MEISGVAVQGIHKKQWKIASSREDLLNEDAFEALLAIFCCHDYEKNDDDASTSESVENIITNALYLLQFAA